MLIFDVSYLSIYPYLTMEYLFDYLMCEHEPIVSTASIILLTIIIPVLLYLLTVKICLWELTKIIPVSADKTILRFYIKQSRATRHPSQLNGKSYTVRHIFCWRTPPPPKLSLPLINFGVINFCGSRPVSRLVDSGIPENSTEVFCSSRLLLDSNLVSQFYFLRILNELPFHVYLTIYNQR